MAKWKYTIRWGKELREAIEAEDTAMVAKCLICCYRELLNEMSDEDKEWKACTIEDSIEVLAFYAIDPDDEDNIDYYLEEFYDICDDVRAWVEI